MRPPITSLPPLNSPLFHVSLQLLHGIQDHLPNSSNRRPRRWLPASPCPKSVCADSKEMCCLFVADVLVLRARLRFRGVAQSGNHAASNSLDEFLFLQAREGRTLLAKQADKRVRNRIPHGLDALLKLGEFLMNLHQFFACIRQTSRCSSHRFPFVE